MSAATCRASSSSPAAIGIRHQEIQTQEFSREGYRRNAGDRCYHCKHELYSVLERLAPRLGFAVIVNGTNKDDLGDYRPGLQAASEHRVRSPLVECGFGKADVRRLAASWELAVWDKPAAPCLSSRVAYGEAVTVERLQMIDRAERWLRDRGFPVVRVRYHRGDVARIEVPPEHISRLCSELRQSLCQELRRLGFRFTTIDLEGFRSGSLNALVQLEERRMSNRE